MFDEFRDMHQLNKGRINQNSVYTSIIKSIGNKAARATMFDEFWDMLYINTRSISNNKFG